MSGSVGHRLDGLKARRLLASLSVTDLARLANFNEWYINQIESGGNCTPAESQRVLDALIAAVPATSSTAANPCVVTSAAHGLQTGDEVVIAGHSGTTPTINGTRTVTRINANTFSIGVDTSGGSTGSGGTCTPTLTSLGLARL